MNFHNAWSMFKYIEFCDVFDLGEKREKLQILKEGIVIEIRNKEDGHNVPHIHAHYQGENISISLIDGEVLAGNIPKKNQKIAVTWVIENLEMLRASWENKHGLIKFPDMIIKIQSDCYKCQLTVVRTQHLAVHLLS